MKYCRNCGSQLSDDAAFCPSCGTRQDSGAPPSQNDRNGGNMQNTPPYGYNAQYNPPPPNYGYNGNYGAQGRPYGGYGYMPQKSVVNILSDREKLVAVFWLIVGILQVIAALAMFGLSIFNDMLIFDAVLLLVIGAVNIVVSVKGFSWANNMLMYPAGILDRYRKNYNGYIGTIVYNSIVLALVLFSVNVFAIIASALAVGVSIFALVGIRDFVNNNAQAFHEIEQNALNANQAAQNNR